MEMKGEGRKAIEQFLKAMVNPELRVQIDADPLHRIEEDRE
jgi:hypothetical protein